MKANSVFIWIQNINAEINQIFQRYKKAFIHKAKLEFFLLKINFFRSHLEKINDVKRLVTPQENQAIRSLVNYLNEINCFIHSLRDPAYIDVLIRYPLHYVSDKIITFINQLNQLIQNAHFSDQPLLEIDEVRFDNINQDDIKNLSKILKDLLDNRKVTTDKREAINYKYNEILELIGQWEEEEEEEEGESNNIDGKCFPLKQYEKWARNHNDFELQKKIGAGAYSNVYLGYEKTTQRVVAIKKLHVLRLKQSDYIGFSRELEIMTKLKHFAILPFVGATLSSPYYIITEFMSGGSLFNKLHKGKLNPTELTIIALGIACGMEYMHSKQMIHRDLKSLNILLDANNYPKIADFGLSRNISSELTMTNALGTIQWMAPEVMNGTKYTEKADVYSYGIILWELLTKSCPFYSMPPTQVVDAVLNRNLRPTLPHNAPKIEQFISICWTKDPERRPSFNTIVKAFKSGEINFPGTNHEEVSTYISQFSIGEENEIDITEASLESVNIIIYKIKNNDIFKGVTTLASIIDKPEWIQVILKSKIFEAISYALKKCDNFLIANELTRIILNILTHDELKYQFTDTKLFLEMFLRFGSTSMSSVIDCFLVLPELVVIEKLFLKLAPFLMAADYKLRIKCLKLLIKVFDQKLYSSINDFDGILNNLIENMIPEGISQILTLSLTLLEKISSISSIFGRIYSNDWQLAVLSLVNVNRDGISDQALDVFITLIKNRLNKQIVINQFLDTMPSICGHSNELKALKILTCMLRSPTTFIEIINHRDTIQYLFNLTISASKSVSIVSLKLIFAFMKNSFCVNEFKHSIHKIIPLLEVESESIRYLAASCFIVAFENEALPVLYTQNIYNFLETSFKKEPKIQLIALKLIGIISTSLKGVVFLKDIYKSVIEYLDSNDKEIRKFATMTLASASASLPLIKDFVECVPKMITLLDEERASLLFIMNMALNPIAAEKCVCKINELVCLISSKDHEVSKQAVTAIDRIIANTETHQLIIENNLINQLIEFVINNLEGEYSQQAFSILYSLSNTTHCRSAFKSTSILSMIERNFDSIALLDPTRKSYLQILARIQ